MDTLSNNLKELKNTLQNISDLQKRTTRGVNMAEKGSVRVPHFKSTVRNNSPPTVPETNEMPAEVAAEDVQAALDAVPMVDGAEESEESNADGEETEEESDDGDGQ